MRNKIREEFGRQSEGYDQERYRTAAYFYDKLLEDKVYACSNPSTPRKKEQRTLLEGIKHTYSTGKKRPISGSISYSPANKKARSMDGQNPSEWSETE